ncbi:MAG: SpoIIE family protein phosphatase [Actinobacteria bacterium]|nr:SpoIIE family protein phosphatase [Actinomycetota bacterium]
MKLTTRLWLFLGAVSIVMGSVAAWEIRAYEIARAHVGKVLPQDQELIHVGNQLAATIAAAAVVDFLLLALASYFARRWVIIPLLRIRKDLNRVSSGELNIGIRATGPLEIAETAKAADDMRRSLVDQIDRTRSIESSISAEPTLTNEVRAALATKFQRFKIHPLEVYDIYQAAEGVTSGDWWDIFSNERGHVIVQVDIQGHDASAAIAGLQSKAVFETAVSSGIDIHRIVKAASDTLADVEAKIATAFVLEIPIDPKSPVRWISAGHPPAVVLYPDGTHKLLNPTGPMLAGFGKVWDIKQFLLEPGMRIMITSDGLLELRNSKKEFFEIEGLLAATANLSKNDGPREVIANISAAMKDFAAHDELNHWIHEDVTVVAIAREQA